MLVSLAWLRDLCPAPVAPDAAAALLTARGLPVDAVLPRPGGDAVLDVDVPANRPDALGHLGVARELSAATGVPMARRPAAPAGTGEPVERAVAVEIEDPAGCPRYTARLVRGVTIGPSPPWVVERLEACGMRSINTVVDASNLVMLELGHPVHFFDLARVRGRRIVVRRPRPGERMATLDGVERPLDPDVLLIADGEGPVALAGIMGGAGSEVSDDTRDVLIEAAQFDPGTVRSAARRLSLATEAAARFGRGTDPEAPPAAQDLAVRLLAELAGGAPAPGMIDVHPRPRGRVERRLRTERVRGLLGYDPGPAAIREALDALGLEPREQPDGSLLATVPSWRVDLDREADLVEEVARHLGYDRVPTARLALPAPVHAGDRAIEERARDLLAHAGFHEGLSYAMVGPGEDDPWLPDGTAPAPALRNPIAEPLSILRRSLLPSLVRAADLNLRRGTRDVRLFEVARVFRAAPGGEGFPAEPAHAAFAWTGAREPRHWSGRAAEVDFEAVSGLVDALLAGLRPGISSRRVPADLAGLHPGRAATWAAAGGGRPLARAGLVHPDLAARLDLAAPVWVGEIDLARLSSLPAALPRHRALPRVPAVWKDLALVLPRAVPWEQAREVLEAVPAPAPAAFEVVDRYEGPPLPAGSISLTVRVILQPLERTLTDAEAEAWRAGLVEAVRERLGVEIRA